MADTLDTITKLINSPPGLLVAGAALAGIVWKFFERVEEALTDQTRFEIAVWLVGVEFGKRVEPLPETFAKVFDRVFGANHLSWKCFFKSCCASIGAFSLATVMILLLTTDAEEWHHSSVRRLAMLAFLNMAWMSFAPDYISLLKTRYLIERLSQARSISLVMLLLTIDAVLTPIITVVGFIISIGILSFTPLFTTNSGVLSQIAGTYGFGLVILGVVPMLVSGYFTSIWLWLYAGSGFLLKAARHFDLGFAWFNRHFDIEKKPLQSIGLVAGAVVAVLYWTAVVVARVL